MNPNNKTLAVNCMCNVTTKLIVEPQSYKYNGPNTKSSDMGIFNGLQHRVEAQQDTGVKTKSAVVHAVNFINNEILTDEMISNLKLANSKLLNFKAICGDSTVEAKIEKFHQALQGKLEKMSKGVVTQTALTKLVQEMEPFNVGMVAKIQLSVTKISLVKFTGAILVPSTGLYHKTVKSKQAFRTLKDIDSTIAEVKALFDAATTAQGKDSNGHRFYEVKDVVLADGTKYKTIAAQGSDLLIAKQRV